MIPFFDQAKQQARIKQRLDTNVAKVLSHGKYILGPEVEELEERLIDYTGAKYCITCANGTDALQIALMAINIKPGDEVIMPAFSYFATAEAAAILGAKPVFVDVDPKTCNIDPALIEGKITNRTKAIIAVSLYGQTADFLLINEIAKRHNLVVIEDGAQSFGAKQNEKKSSALSDIGCTSFFPTKPLGCYGDGGAIFTSSFELADRIRKIARHGQAERYLHTCVGMNSRLDTLQAAILLAKLEILDEEISRRNVIAEIYNSELDRIPGFRIPTILAGNVSAWGQYTLLLNDRSRVQEKLKSDGVPSFVHYPMPLNRQPAIGDFKTIYNQSEELASKVLSIPISPYLTDGEIDFIIDSLSHAAK